MLMIYLVELGQVRQGSIIDDLAESEPTYLAKQNKDLRRLLVECRKELYEVHSNTYTLLQLTLVLKRCCSCAYSGPILDFGTPCPP